ncbi:MAG TPA: MFS transporter [Verrucomicrobiae bacterium]|jgi:MFS family permease|nr:MFS transporter [Verrucomicrobiae bacterium]
MDKAPPNSTGLSRAAGVLRNRAFLVFWVGACISNTGNWTENAAQSWAVTSQTAGQAHQALFVEILQFADFCPVLLLALVAGVISDRVNRKTWLIILQSAACALGVGLAVAAFLGKATPWVVIVFTFLEGIVWALNGPVFLAVVPSLVTREQLSPALALNSVQFNMARLCGPMLAAGIIGAVGIAGAFTFNALTFLPLLIALLISIPSAPAPARPANFSVLADLREGVKFVWTSPGTRRLTVMSVAFMFLAAPLQGLLPVFAQSILKGGPTMFGLMLSAIGLGSILGAFILSFIPSYYPRHHLIPLAMCVFAALGLLFSFSRTPALSLGILVCSGMFWLLSLNPTNTANQLLATDANRGRVLSIMLLANQGGLPLGHLCAGFLTHYMSPPLVLRLMMGILLVVMLVFLFVREPAIDNMARRQLGPRTFWETIWEAITANSHHPDYPAETSAPGRKREPGSAPQ